MSKEAFVCETVKEVLVEIAKADKSIFTRETQGAGCRNLDGIVDSLVQSLCSTYDKHFKSPRIN